MLSCGLILKPEIWPMSSNHCSLGQYLRLPPLFEGKIFCLHVLSILHIYFSFICQLVWAIDHNLWESCISLLEKLERKAHSKHIQELWNPTRNFFTSLQTEELNFALAHSLISEISVNCSWMYNFEDILFININLMTTIWFDRIYVGSGQRRSVLMPCSP